jgi:PAS domain S-box-containing protein
VTHEATAAGSSPPEPAPTAADAVLAETGLLDAAQTAPMQAVAALAARICGMPMAAVSLVEGDRQFFAGSIGLSVSGTDRSSSFCAVAMQTPDEPMLVPDALADPRFSTNPLVLGAPEVRSYAGMPLTAHEGVALGAVCALATSRTDLDAGQVESLRHLGTIASELLDARRTATRLGEALAQAEQARTAVAASRARLLHVVEHAPLGITVVSAQGRYVEVNAAFATLLDRSVDELVGRSSWEFTTAEDAREDAAAASRMLAVGKGMWRREKSYLRPDGSHVRAMVTSSLIVAQDGSEPVLLSQIESVEQRREAESRLLELQSSHDGIISTDDSGRVTAWNLGAQRLLGHSAEAMLGHSLERIIPTGMLAEHQAGVERLLRGEPPRLVGGTAELPAVHADGRRLLVELSLSGWTQDGRNGFTAVLRDITARRRTELLADLLRTAASTANSAPGFADGAQTVLSQVCEQLGWVAGQAWTAEATTAVWALQATQPRDPARLPSGRPGSGRRCPDPPSSCPWTTQTRVATAESLAGSTLGASPCWPAASARGRRAGARRW